MTRLSISILATLLLAGQALAQPVSCAGSLTCLSIDVTCDAAANPNACPLGVAPGGVAAQTQASGINPRGQIVGTYTDSVGGQHGFFTFLDKDSLRVGPFYSIDVPGAVATSANGISPSGDIVGSYVRPYIQGTTDVGPHDSPTYCPAATSPACIKGFIYSQGTFSTVLYPKHAGAIPQRITSDGTIYGCIHDSDLTTSMFGGVWSRLGNENLDTNGGEVADGMARPMSMNNGGTPDGHIIVGLWNDMPTNHRHGFIVRNGQFESYDGPAATLTAIWDINSSQQFVGTYITAGVRHGFLQNPGEAALVKIDYPGAAGSIAYGINAGGIIVGQYTMTGRSHGFAAIP